MGLLNVFDLKAKLGLDSSEYNEELEKSESKGSKFGSGLKKAAGVAAGAITAATGAVVAFTGKSVQAGMDFDSAMSQVAATMGVTTDEIGNLRDFAQEMGSTTAFSATQAAEALNYMALAGYDADTSIAMLPNVLNLAAAGDIDLAYASDMVTDASSALGLSLDETALMVDQMAMASSKSNTSVAQLGEAMLTIGATARSIKGGTTELTTVLGALADNGIKGAEGGTHLRNMILSLQNPTDEAAATLDALGISVYDADGNMRSMISIITDLQRAVGDMDNASRDAVVSGIFNKTDLAAVNALLNTTPQRFGELTREINSAAFNADSFKLALDDVGLSFDDLQKNIDALGDVNLSGNLESYLKSSGMDAEALAQAMYEDADATISYDDIVKALGGDLGKIQKAFDNTTGSAQKMADTQLDNLAGDITLFQSALEGAQIAISDSVTPSLRDFVQFGTDGISRLTVAFQKNGLSGAMGELGNIISDGAKMLLEHAPEFVDAGMQLLGAVGQGFIDNIGLIADTGAQILVKITSSLAENSEDIVPGIVTVIHTLVSTFTKPEVARPLLEGGIQIIVGIISGIAEATPELVGMIPEIIANFCLTIEGEGPLILKAVADILGSLGQMVLGSIGGLMGMSYDEIAQAFADVLGAAQIFGNDVKSWFTNTKNNMISNVQTFFSNIWTNTKNGLNNVFSSITGFGTKVKDNIKQTFENAKNTVREAVEAFKNFFKFDWQLPKPKLPHFSVSGGEAPWGFGGQGSLPSISIDWYKKAMNEPYFLDSATIFGAAGGQLLGGGEAGSEVIVGTDRLMSMMKQAIGVSRPIEINIYASEGQDIRQLAKEVGNVLQDLLNDKEKVYA